MCCHSKKLVGYMSTMIYVHLDILFPSFLNTGLCSNRTNIKRIPHVDPPKMIG